MAGGQLGTTLVFTPAGELIVAPSSTSASGTLAAGYLQPLDATSGALSWTLPAASSVTVGGPMVAVKKIDTGANTVTINRAGSDVILGTGTGVTTRVLTLAGETVYLQSDGISKWTVVSNDVNTSLVLPVATANAYQDSREYRNNGSPTFLRENFDRANAGADQAAALATGVMTSCAIPLNAGEVITNLTFMSGATAANTPTHWWFALYSSAGTPALLAQTADQTSTAWAANTAKTLALTAPQTIATTGVYYASIMMAATGVVSLIGKNTQANAAGAIVAGMAILGQTSGSALTTTAPATITAATTVGTIPLVILT